VTIERADFEKISEEDIKELIEAEAPEGPRLEYKLTTYGTSSENKRELLKDVSAFANSHGGHLILGIRANKGVATEMVGIDILDPDAEILRMEQILRSGLEPPVSGVRIKAIQLESNGHVIIVRIPVSWYPPHRVISGGKKSFHVRNSAGVHEPSVEELRTLFTQSTSALEQARNFRDQRIKYIQDSRGDYPLEGNGRLVLHIVPVAAFSGMINIDVEVVSNNYESFQPIGSSGRPRFNFHGVINERGGQSNYGYTQIFRNGILEATKANIVPGSDRIIPGLKLQSEIFEVFHPYLLGLQDVGVPPPLIIMFTFEDVRDARYIVVAREIFYDSITRFQDDVLTLPECLIENYGTEVDHHKAVRPAFDALWNASGFPKSQFYNEEGKWVGPHKRA